MGGALSRFFCTPKTPHHPADHEAENKNDKQRDEQRHENASARLGADEVHRVDENTDALAVQNSEGQKNEKGEDKHQPHNHQLGELRPGFPPAPQQA